MNATTLPILEGTNVLLRNLAASDDTAIYALRSDDRVNKFLDRPVMSLKEEAAQFIQKILRGIEHDGWLYWAVVTKDDPSTLVGTICLWNISADKTTAEIGYELLPVHQRRGFMQDAVRTLLQFAFGNIGLQTVEAYTHPLNIQSSRLLEKFNFKLKEKQSSENEPGQLIAYTLSPIQPAH